MKATVDGADLSEFSTFAAARKHFTENVSDSECEVLVGLVKDLLTTTGIEKKGGKRGKEEREREREREKEKELEKEKEQEKEKEKEKGGAKKGMEMGSKLETLSSSVAFDVKRLGDESNQMRTRVC